MKEIYKQKDIADNAYLLKSGKIYLDILKIPYEISGDNLIVGAAEIIINFDNPIIPTFRLCSMKASDDAELEPIRIDVLKGLIHRSNIGFNVCRFLSKFLIILNRIQSELKIDDESKDEYNYNVSAKKYYQLVDELNQISEELKFVDILELVKSAKNELLYEAGRGLFHKRSTNFKINDKSDLFKTLPSEEIICKQGEEADDFFILDKGVIAIEVNGIKVAEINKSGSVIGEMSLFLEEKRTATIRAKTDVRIHKVRRDDLNLFAENNIDFFDVISKSIAEKIKNSFSIIRHLNQENENVKIGKVPGFLHKEPWLDKLGTFSFQVLELWKKKKYPKMGEYIKRNENEFTKYSKKLKN